MDDDTHFRKHLRAERVGLVQSSLLLLLQAIFTAALPLPLMVLIDGFIFSFLGTLQPRPNVAITPLTERLLTEFTSRPTEHLLWWAIGLLGFLLLASAALEWVEQISRTRVSYAVVERLREEMFERLITRRQGYLDRKRKSDLIAHLSTDAGALESLIGSGLGTFARALPTLILMFTLLLWLQPSLAFLVLVTLPLPYYLTLYLARATRIHSARLRSATQNFESEAMRLFAAAPIIKSLTLESFAARVLHSRLEETGQVVLNVRQADGALIAASGGARHALRAVLLVLGGILILRGELSFGALAVFLVAVGPLSRAVASIAQFVSDFGRAESSRDRVEALFAELESQGEVQGPQAWISLPFPDATTLHFENVTFGYQGAPPLLQKFNASFHSGELIALTGPSGSGRTTFSRLLNRLLDPTEGRILLGRTDIKRFRMDVLRTYVTVVDHETFFVSGTLRENLLLGAESSEIREQQISEALHATNAYDFIQNLPEKLDTWIGEGGYELSASQLRRLGLARAFLREQSQVFVLDEPTTGLDADSAAAVVTTIHRLAERGATVFWITNRLEEIPQCDQVVLFSRLREPRVSTHEELMVEDPGYRAYFVPTESPRVPRGRGQPEARGSSRPGVQELGDPVKSP